MAKGYNMTNAFLAFCSQFNKQSGRKPIDRLFCGHEWEFINSELGGLVDYGGPIVYGTHVHWKCKWCGKHRYKIFKGDRFKIYTRKEMEEKYKKMNYKKPLKQLEFI
jgi:hypothetical protein